MTAPQRPLQPLNRWLVATLCAALGACAQTPDATPDARPAAPSASTASSAPTTAPTAAAPAPSRARAYAGHFESSCQQLGEAFYTRDLVDLAAVGEEVEARYGKAIHDAEGCTPASLVVVFQMPPVRWTFDGTVQAHNRTVDRIQTRPVNPDGQLTATQARTGWLTDTPTQFLLRRNGRGTGLPVDKAVEQPPTRELRLLTSQRLYTSASDSAPDTYPAELDLEGYLERKPAP